MVLIEPVGHPLGDLVRIFLDLALVNSFNTWEVFLVGVSLGSLGGFMIGNEKGYLVCLSLGLPLVSPVEYRNPGDVLPGTLLGGPLGLWFGSESVRFKYSCRRLTDLCESNFVGVDISCDPPSGALFKYNMNSVSYCQLL